MPGSQTTRGGANPRAGGPAPIAFCCHDGIGTPDYIAFAAHNLACTHPCQRFAGSLAALTHDSGPVWDATPFTVMDSHLQPPAGLPAHRGSMAGLCAPLPTLRPRPRERVRTARGRCGLLLLHRSGLTWAFSGQVVRLIGTSKKLRWLFRYPRSEPYFMTWLVPHQIKLTSGRRSKQLHQYPAFGGWGSGGRDHSFTRLFKPVHCSVPIAWIRQDRLGPEDWKDCVGASALRWSSSRRPR